MGNIVAALIYLRITTLRNMILSRLYRLRQPKYLLGAVIGIAYLYFFLFRSGRARARIASGMDDLFTPDQIAGIAILCAVCLLGFIVLCWVWSRERASLSFSEAEIAFLFPAPIGRKSLIHFRLIDMQLKLVFSSLILGLVSGRWQFVQGDFAIRFVGWWIFFSIINLHIAGSAFSITKWSDRGVTTLYRRIAVTAFVGALVLISWLTVWREWPAAEASDQVGIAALARHFSGMLDNGVFGILLLPFKWALQPLFAADMQSFLLALGPAIAVLAAHYLWVLYSEASFEEASIAAAQKRATRLASVRSGHYGVDKSKIKLRRTPFKLASAPRVEFAFLWKNLLSTAEYLSFRNAMIAAVVIVAGNAWLRSGDHDILRNVIGSVAVGIAAYMLVFGPMVARQDLRSDLLNTDILKSYPLLGWQIVLGEILTPIVTVTVLMWLLLLTAALAFEPARAKWLTSDIRLWSALSLALLMPLLCAVQVLVLNASAVLFPAWIQTDANKGRGIEVMGQGILFFAGLLLAMVAALLPAVIAASVVYFLAQFLLGAVVAGVLAFLLAMAILTFEIALGIQWLGKRFENFDLSSELRP